MTLTLEEIKRVRGMIKSSPLSDARHQLELLIDTVENLFKEVQDCKEAWRLQDEEYAKREADWKKTLKAQHEMVDQLHKVVEASE